ncbi:efflux RND transporter periplasmic adaptor subunit [Alteromonas sp. AMM-1]|jgi:cobalt-zinc-cadmium efflux system membrane fusion protein|uniref:efflux RND transporter periplasmic adaptor subunit n=1 Tax=Alteromonas sp. AMM-1 TaxID=3394233 RepID=UPI0039A60E58
MINFLLRPLMVGLIAFAFLGYAAFSFASEADHHEEEPEKGEHRGRLLKDGDFVLELAIVEAGVPPEFRVWIMNDGKPVKPEDVSLVVTLTRLGNVIDTINFKPQADFLRGDMEIYEPHSFVVTIKADHQGKKHQWQYDNFEGRTRIESAVAEAMDIQTELAGEATLVETIESFGKIVPQPDAERKISARFEGEITTVHARLGQTVKAGDKLITINSNESLKSFTISSPINGVVTSKAANPGEQSGGRILMSIVDTSKLTAELSVFSVDRKRVAVGAEVTLHVNGQEAALTGRVNAIDAQLNANQASTVRVEINNADSTLSAGQFITGDIEVSRYAVPIAVKRVGLQAFRDFTVVYAKVGDEYEVRMLELGREAGEWVEVLGGLNPGTEYVTDNSFIIKADIEKSGASHDH